MLVKKVPEARGHRLGRLTVEAGGDDFILHRLGNQDLGRALGLDQGGAECGLAEHRNGGFALRLRHGGDLFVAGVGAVLHLGEADQPIPIQRVGQPAGKIVEGEAIAGLDDSIMLLLAQLWRQSGKAYGKGGERVLVVRAGCDLLKELLEADTGPALHGDGLRLLRLGHAHGVDEVEALLGWRIGRDGLELQRIEGAHAAPAHLLEIDLGSHVAEEDQHLDRFHIRACRDHVDGDGDAGEVAVAELLDQLVGVYAGDTVGDLLGKVIVTAEHLAGNRHNLLGVMVILGEDEGLRHMGAAGEQHGGQTVPIGLQHRADPIRRQHGPVERFRREVEIFLQRLVALLPGALVPHGKRDASLDPAAFLAHAGADAEHFERHVDAIDHRSFVRIFSHEVVAEVRPWSAPWAWR
ncbi:MAG: hypothetical protein RMK78_10555 [Thermaurantiacus sp.]|uniref:hypothetical protein n=1 Tax=Thermaurantiacus sp. TaxID=2820283 RepID=UPI00298F1C06|nr:hypothetical protein [Thermaurantiacus sp.]MDW8415886.1 hypothetical protein [Thermaurantiacus sp.]